MKLNLNLEPTLKKNNWLMLLALVCVQAMGQSTKYNKQTVTEDIKAYQSFLRTGAEIKGGINSFVSMGTDEACDFDSTTNTISDVIATGVNEIRLASNGTYQDNINLINRDLILRGGFSTCLEAEDNQQTFSDLIEIDGSIGFAPVVHIRGDESRNLVRLENLILTGGFTSSGGGLFVESADAEVQLLRVVIDENQAQEGGGISIDFGTVDLFGQDVLVLNNKALTQQGYGGGIYCHSALNSITLTGLSVIYNNEASKGGGLYSSVCKINFYSSAHPEIISFFAGVINNSTTDVGGGMLLRGRTEVNFFGQKICDGDVCLGSNEVPIMINDNTSNLDDTANADGGGIYMEKYGLTPKLYANGLQMVNNMAGGNGGAIYATEGSTVIIDRVSRACWEQDRCNLFEANQSSDDIGFGGAFYIDNSSAEISHAYIEANRADYATALMVTGNESIVSLEHSVLDDNGNEGMDGYSDINLIRLSLGANMSIKHTTIADNDLTSSVFSIDLLPSSLELLSSIIDEPNGVPIFPPVSGILNINCIISHEDNSFNGSNVLVANPQFIDRSTGNFHLSGVSPAIDRCTDVSPNVNLDMDSEPLGWDDPNQPNGEGVFDAGADETYLNDIIFMDGFEA